MEVNTSANFSVSTPRSFCRGINKAKAGNLVSIGNGTIENITILLETLWSNFGSVKPSVGADWMKLLHVSRICARMESPHICQFSVPFFS